VSGNAGKLNAGPRAFFREHVTVASTTGLHLDPHVSYPRRGNLALDDLEIGSRCRNLRYLHGCDGDAGVCSRNGQNRTIAELFWFKNSKMEVRDLLFARDGFTTKGSLQINRLRNLAVLYFPFREQTPITYRPVLV